MVDVVDKETRSRMMSGIRSRNTFPERQIRSGLHRNGFRFRLNVRNLPGTPDIVLKRYQAVVFVHGCFWHGHSCSLFKWPKTRRTFWRKKIERNREKDRQAIDALRSSGWRVCVVWECALKNKSNAGTVIAKISRWLTSNRSFWEVKR